MKKALKQWPPFIKALPIIKWLPGYNRQSFIADIIAASIVTVLLIPQSLAYALLAGLPVELGLYASIWPLVLYALLGSSRTLSVGPVAVISLMTASTIGSISQAGIATAVEAAIALSFLSGAILLLMGILRFGFLANFLSHGVISGFITASGIIIAVSQLKHILGISLHGESLWQLGHSLFANIQNLHIYTAILGSLVLTFLWGTRTWGQSLFIKLGARKSSAQLLSKVFPAIAVAMTLGAALLLSFEEKGIALVGAIPQGLPALELALPSITLIKTLLVPALIIALIGYVESVSVGMTLAAKRRETINANSELIALGAANIGSGASGAFPVTGGFSRSVVNFDAGAQTQMASIFTAAGITLAALFLTPYLYFLPKATLAATIIIAVLSLVDFSILKKTWRFSRADFWAVTITLVITLMAGVEVGVSAGVISSLLLFIYRSSMPHMAEVGRIPDTEHFRNIQRHTVETCPSVYMLRIDESLFFANSQAFEQHIYQAIYQRDAIYHVVLVCTAINAVDYSALEALERINHRLQEQGVKLHLAEVKGPVKDLLEKTHLFHELTGEIFLSQNLAYESLKNPNYKQPQNSHCIHI